MSALDPKGPPTAHLFRKATDGIGEGPGALVVMDASFNPMTLAHERMIAAAAQVQPADEVLLLLSAANVDKQVFGASLGQRMAMLLAYVEGSDSTSAAGCSHARFVDKAVALQALYPRGTDISFIIGYDTLVRLFDPAYYGDLTQELDDLFGRASFLVANRYQAGLDAIESVLGQQLSRPYRQCITPIRLDSRHADMSSTQVRDAISAGGSADHLVPQRVVDAIQRLDLYRAA